MSLSGKGSLGSHGAEGLRTGPLKTLIPEQAILEATVWQIMADTGHCGGWKHYSEASVGGSASRAGGGEGGSDALFSC